MKILFIGNSYTYFNDMPARFLSLVKENGKNIEVDSVTCGGRKLCENIDKEDQYSTRIRELAEANEYDVLILQEQSYLALVDCESFERGVLGLSKLVGAKRDILYATWGRKSGSELLAKYGWTSGEMTEKLHSAYCLAAEKCKAEVSPVGLCFLALSESGLELYDPDLSHPSYLGTALGTLMHYKTVFGELPKSCASLALDAEAEKQMLGVVSEVKI